MTRPAYCALLALGLIGLSGCAAKLVDSFILEVDTAGI